MYSDSGPISNVVQLKCGSEKHRRSLKICYRNPQNMLTNLVQLLIPSYSDMYLPGQCHKSVKCFLQHQYYLQFAGNKFHSILIDPKYLLLCLLQDIFHDPAFSLYSPL